MRYINHLVVTALAGMALVALTTIGTKADDHQAGIQASDKVLGGEPIVVDGFRYGGGLARGSDENIDALRALIRAANATGQIRDSVYFGFNQHLVIGDTTNKMRIVGNGTWKGEAVDVRLEWDYRLPGVRFFITHADGSRDITVALDTLAWDEDPQGVYKQAASTSAQERLVLAYLMPTAVALTGRDAGDRMTLSKDGSSDVLTIPVPVLGTDLVARLNGLGQPVHTEIDFGGKVYTADFRGEFLNDRGDYEVYFPRLISMQVDGETFADWELDYHLINPYLIFPVPEEVAAN